MDDDLFEQAMESTIERHGETFKRMAEGCKKCKRVELGDGMYHYEADDN